MIRPLALLPLLWLAACPSREREAPHTDPAEPSPNASIMPAPLASGAEPGRDASAPDAGRGGLPVGPLGRFLLPEAGPPAPTLMPSDKPLPRDTLTAKDSTGATLAGLFRWVDVPAPASVPELDKEGLKAAREKTSLKVTIDLASAGRMRLGFEGVAFPVAPGSALRARLDRWGNLLVWPNQQSYRILPPGSLRAVFAERRADLTPLVNAAIKSLGKATSLGIPTERVTLTTQTGTLTLEQGHLAAAGPSGALLCRVLVELVAADPSTSACSPELTPLRAELAWPDRGRIIFEVLSVTRRQDLPIGELYTPPADAELARDGMPPETTGVFLTREELAAFRSRDASSAEPSPAGAPGEGLLAVNYTDTLRYLLLDGVAVAWLKPHGQQYVIGPRPGTYVVSWRDFLGAQVEPPATMALPARVELGAVPDAGAVEH